MKTTNPLTLAFALTLPFPALATSVCPDQYPNGIVPVITAPRDSGSFGNSEHRHHHGFF